MKNLFFRVYAVFYWGDIVKKNIAKSGRLGKKDIKEGEDQLGGCLWGYQTFCIL